MRRFIFAFVLAFVLSAAAVSWMLLRAADAAVVGPPGLVSLDAWASLAPQIEKLSAEAENPDRVRVVFLGDSTAVAYPEGEKVPQQLERQLTRRGRGSGQYRVYSLGFSAMHPFDYYFLSEPLMRTHPDQIVMSFNLYALSDKWRQYFSRPELAGWIPPARWLQAARLPLYWQGVTFDGMIFDSCIVQLGAAPLWYRAQKQSLRIAKAYQGLERRFQGEVGRRAPKKARDLWIEGGAGRRGPRQGPVEVRQRYGVAIDGVSRNHPVLRVLGAAVAEYTGAGIPVTVYLVPTNVEHFARIGVQNDAGLESTVQHLREVVETAGGQFVDLHRLLPDEGFRDPAGHFTHSGRVHGPALVAAELAKAITERSPVSLHRPAASDGE